MSSEDFIRKQREALAGLRESSSLINSSYGISANPRSGSLPFNPAEQERLQEQSRREARASSMAALQSQLAQLGQGRQNDPAPNALPAAILGDQYLVFSLLDYEFAFKAEYIQGVERLVDVTPVPNVASWVRGVINLRGSIASVVDLRSFLDMEQLPYNPRTRLLSVQYNEMVICLVVDGVNEMVPIPSHAIIDASTRQTNIPQWAIPYASGSALLDNRRIVVLLDAARLLFSEKMQHYAEDL